MTIDSDNGTFIIVDTRGIAMMEGNVSHVVEFIESELEKKLGFSIIIQEDVFNVSDIRLYLHSDNIDDRTPGELKTMSDNGLMFEDDDMTNISIRNILNIDRIIKK